MFSVMRGFLDDHTFNCSSNFDLLPRIYMNSSPAVRFYITKPRLRTNLSSDTKTDSKNYQVLLDVEHYQPEEIEVKIVDDSVVIHGKHEERADEHGFVSREFSRRYQLPDDIDPDSVKSLLSPDGVLAIQGSRKQLEPPPKNEKIIPITIEQRVAIEEEDQGQGNRTD